MKRTNHIRRALALLLAALLALSLTPALAENGGLSDLLTLETWSSPEGDALAFRADGTGTLTRDQSTYDIAWTAEGEKVTCTYELYGVRTLALSLQDIDGAPGLISDDGLTVFRPATAQAPAAEAPQSDAYPIAPGEPIDLDFVSITIDSVRQTRTVGAPVAGGVSVYYSPAAGSRYFCAVGTIANKGKASITLNNVMAARLVFDGQYQYDAKCYVVNNSSAAMELAALGKAELYLAASVPEGVAETFSRCEVGLGFNDRFASAPESLEKCDFQFTAAFDGEAYASAFDEPARELTFYEDSPALPVPTSFADVKQNSHSKSSSNGRLSKLQYAYGPLYSGEDINALFNAYVDGLLGMGYEVTQSGGVYTVKLNGTKLAEITLDTSIHMDIATNNQKLTPPAAPSEKPAAAEPATVEALPETEAEALPTAYVGDTITTHTAALSLLDQGTSTELRSYTSRKPSFYMYKYPGENNSLRYVHGKIKNTSNREVNISNIYVQFIIDDTYVYDGYFIGLRGDGRNFQNDLAAQDTIECYFYADIPNGVLNSAKSTVVRLGFTDDYAIRVHRADGYAFDLCDEVYEIDLNGRPAATGAGAAPNLTVVTDRDTVRALQQALNDAGYSCGTPDGVAGKKTGTAAASYQRDHGLVETGTLTQQLADALLGSSGN